MSNQIVVTQQSELMTEEQQNELRKQQRQAMKALGELADQKAEKATFSEYKIERTDNTLRAQQSDLDKFADYLVEHGVPYVDGDCLYNDPQCWQGVTWGLVKGFKKWMLNESYSIAAINRAISTVKVYAGLAYGAGEIKEDDYAKIRLVKTISKKAGKEIDKHRKAAGVSTRIEQVVYTREDELVTRKGTKKAKHTKLTSNDAKNLKDLTLYDGDQWVRDCLMMCLLLDHGLRCGEVAILKAGDFNLADGTFKLYRPKVDKKQTHELTKDTTKALELYLNVRPEKVIDKDGNECDLLLVGSTRHLTLTNKAMSDRAITKRVNYLGKKIAHTDNLSAHDCRHYWATYWAKRVHKLERGTFQLQEAGGWSSLAMPRHYTEDATIANKGMA